MARSIHITWKEYWEKQRFEYADREQQAQELDNMRKALIRKQVIKRQRKVEKNPLVTAPLSPSPDQHVYIEVKDQGEYIHYPLTPDDVKACLETLPAGTTFGLHTITFCLGKKYMKEVAEDHPDQAVDPYTGRIRGESSIPDCFLPPVLGTYNYRTHRIFLYAYVYPSEVLREPTMVFYLKLKMLSTLLHEIAHHDDNWRRVARGRWLGSYDTRVEDYAYRKQREWVNESLIKVLQGRYQSEITQLINWIETYGGCKIPFEEIIKGGFIFSTAQAVEDLFGNVLSGTPEDSVQYRFARQLYYSGHPIEALTILNTCLPKSLDKLKVKTLIADIHRHQGTFHLAESLASEILSDHPEHETAIAILSEVYFAAGRWQPLIEMTQKGLSIAKGTRKRQILWYLEKQLLAYCKLGKYEQAKSIVDQYPDHDTRRPRKQAFQSLVLLANQDFQGARQLAAALLNMKPGSSPVAQAIAKVVFNAASIRLGKGHKTRKLSAKNKSILNNSKIGTLACLQPI